LELPPGAHPIRPARIDWIEYRYALELDAPARVRLHLYWFPGWRLWLDGAPAPDRLGRGEEGLIALDLPAGNCEVRLKFVGPPVSRGALALSGAMGLALSIWAFWPLTRRRRRNLSPSV
jgi:hypothetical protein